MDIRDSFLDADLTSTEQVEEGDRLKALEQDYRNCFTSESGKKVLADLFNRTVMTQGGEIEPLANAFQEGRKNIVLSIMKRIGAVSAKPSFLEAFEDGRRK